MNAVDRIAQEVGRLHREYGTDAFYFDLGFSLRMPEAEALCDVVSHARTLLDLLNDAEAGTEWLLIRQDEVEYELETALDRLVDKETDNDGWE